MFPASNRIKDLKGESITENNKQNSQPQRRETINKEGENETKCSGAKNASLGKRKKKKSLFNQGKSSQT